MFFADMFFVNVRAPQSAKPDDNVQRAIRKHCQTEFEASCILSVHRVTSIGKAKVKGMRGRRRGEQKQTAIAN